MMMERNETVPLAIFRFESDNFYYSMHWQKGGKERQDIHNGLQVHFFRSLQTTEVCFQIHIDRFWQPLLTHLIFLVDWLNSQC